ncbi:hypothetical protein niasHT_002090 [Heterodera trifolii]|uniref:Protein root UVB sensitive/RUS domain-containing protein n=1 Tax=Heterodera trifolii TaxID=157864 RepID=A0ABD2M3V2_9BILA
MPKQSASQIAAIEEQQQNIVETYNGEPVYEYSFARPRGDDGRLALRKNSLRKRVHSVRAFFAEVFLLQGYPGYRICLFSEWHFGQLAVLKGVGVGNEQATVLAAALTWILKDGVGMLARIAFAWAKGTRLDSDCKRWRLFADLLNDASFFIVLSLLCSLVLLPQVEGRPFTIWALFLLFTAVHLFANYRAMKCIQLETLNPNRLTLATLCRVRHRAIRCRVQSERAYPRHFCCSAPLWLSIGPTAGKHWSISCKTVNASPQTAATATEVLLDHDGFACKNYPPQQFMSWKAKALNHGLPLQ